MPGVIDRRLIANLAQGRERLMQALSACMTDDMLEEIARADYGMDYDAHLAELKALRSGSPSRGRMRWEPKEVLELFRWSEFGDNRIGQTPQSPVHFHIMRAFCCTALLEACVDPANDGFMDGPNSNLVQLLESLELAGPELEREAPPFFAGLIARLRSGEDESGFFVLALLWSLLRARFGDIEPALIVALSDAVLAEEQRVRNLWGKGVGSRPNRWLLGTTHFDLRAKKWEAIGDRLRQEAERTEAFAACEKLVDIAIRLTVDGEW